MENVKHSAEPWSVYQTPAGKIGGTEVQAVDRPSWSDRPYSRMLCQMGFHPDEQHAGRANAARIVVCVNACAGMDRPADDIAQLRAYRDELKTALSALYNAMPAPRTRKLTIAWDAARAVVAKAELRS